MGNPRRTTAYCLQRRVLSESFGVSLYSRRRARRCANCLLPPPQPSPTGRGSCSAVLPAVVFYIDSRNQRRESMPAIPPFCPLPRGGGLGWGQGYIFPGTAIDVQGYASMYCYALKPRAARLAQNLAGIAIRRIYNSSATATKKTSISDTAKKHQNIAGDRKWMPTVILRPLSGVA